MTTYIIRRLFHAMLVILVVSALVFFLMRLLPGDPILMYVTMGDLQDITQEEIDRIMVDNIASHLNGKTLLGKFMDDIEYPKSSAVITSGCYEIITLDIVLMLMP